MYSKINVENNGNGGASDVIGKCYISELKNIISGLEREDDRVRILGNLAFKNADHVQIIEFTQNSFSGNEKGDGDPGKAGISQTVEFEFPGNELEIRAARMYYLNKNVIVIFDHCDPNIPADLYGTPCAPMQLKYDAKEDKDGTSTKFTFESTNKSKVGIAQYFGTLTLAETPVVPADTTIVDVASGPGEYQLSDNAAACEIVDFANAIEGKVYTLKGSGGVHPAVLNSAAKLLLKSGAAWTGLAGASISVKAFKDGAATFKYIEQSRS